MADTYDLIVIGAGPAGAQGAALAASLGRRVALVEREPYLGGAGLTTGTMPSKMLREAAVTLSALRQRAFSSLRYTLQPGTRLSDLMYNKDIVVDAAWGAIRRNCERLNIRIVRGTAAFKDPHTLVVSGPGEGSALSTELSGDRLLVATGSAPIRPPQFPFDHAQVCDSQSVLNLERLPRSVAIVGGGTIGCEYASIFNALGVPVTVIERGDRVLPGVDHELAQRWQQHQQRLGVQFLVDDDVVQVTAPAAGQPGDLRLALLRGSELAADLVLVAVGRRPNLAGLNLAAAGLAEKDDGCLVVDDHFQTPVSHIYAAGDVVGAPALASSAMVQGRLAVAHAFGQALPHGPVVHPVAVYTIPEMAMVGLSEVACQARNLPYAVGRAYFRDNPYAQITGDTSGLLKLIFSPSDRRLIGVELMCDSASDLIHQGAQVLAAGGTLDSFTQAVYNYPTLSEAYQAAAFDGLERLAWRTDPGEAAFA